MYTLMPYRMDKPNAITVEAIKVNALFVTKQNICLFIYYIDSLQTVVYNNIKFIGGKYDAYNTFNAR